jgi:hypothetical protein
MRIGPKTIRFLPALLLAVFSQAFAADTDDAGMIKTVSGNVMIKRGADSLQAAPGMMVKSLDVVQTAKQSTVGIMLCDNSMLSAGPESELRLDKFNFDSKTQKGEVATTLKRGSLAGISGAIAKHSPEAVRFKTASLTLGVRGTKFIIEAADRGD